MSDKRKHKKSKEEIAKEFDLPERKSKIATIMKQDAVYCICRTSDVSRFMIACDGCEEWYHGDCINISAKESKHIRQYYCNRCKQENPDLQTIFRLATDKPTTNANKDSAGSHSNFDVDKRNKPNNNQNPKTNGTVFNCGQCDGCELPDCGECETCLGSVSGIERSRCQLRVCFYTAEEFLEHQQEQVYEQQQQQRQQQQQQQQPPPRNVNGEGTYKRNRYKQQRDRTRKRKCTPPPSEKFINPDLEGLRHCFGPECQKNARPQSKYCCDECGIKLATARIFQVLPQRLQEWDMSQCLAEVENTRQLDQIRSKQSVVRYVLDELDNRQQELDMVVERAKHSTLDPNRSQDNNEFEDEQSMYCITCGHEIHSRTAIKHMEKCFNKYESQASFGSIFKTRIEGNTMFCDFYNPASQTYCKRLRVLCPEHFKDPKVNDNDVCGCPLVRNVFELTGEFCRAPKKSCFKHYVWEKIRRAEIDLERVRQWIKMDELLEQERQIRAQMSSRAGLLSLMLHSTYNHDFLDDYVRKKFACNKQQNQNVPT